MVEWAVITILVGGLIYAAFSYVRILTASSDSTREAALLESSPQTVIQYPTVSGMSSPTASLAVTTGRTAAPIQSSALLLTGQPASLPVGPKGRIVFTCTPEKYDQLCLMNADGSDLIRLTDRKANDYYPSFSPDGKSIIFVSNLTGQFEIYILDLQLKKEKRVTDGLGIVTAPESSPDGRWIVFASRMSGDSSIWLIPREGGKVRSLTDSRWNEVDPSWSPDGTQIAFTGVRGGLVELYVMTLGGSDISNNPAAGSSFSLRQATQEVLGIGGRSSWSPDGAQLVFYAGSRGDRDIYVVNVVTGLAARLTFGGNNVDPCFSPDGDWIAFSSSRDGDHEIYVMRADGSEITQLTDNTYADWQPDWGP